MTANSPGLLLDARTLAEDEVLLDWYEERGVPLRLLLDPGVGGDADADADDADDAAAADAADAADADDADADDADADAADVHADDDAVAADVHADDDDDDVRPHRRPMQNGLKILKLPARYEGRSVTVIGWCVRTGYLEYALLPGWRVLRTKQWRAADQLHAIAAGGLAADPNHYYATEPSAVVREIVAGGDHVRASLVCNPEAWPEIPRPHNWESLVSGEAAPANEPAR